jgi:iron-sulfur cluster repair protein YtfE (RIC family)
MKDTDKHPTDALLLLHKDHRRISDLFRSADRDPGVFDEIRTELEAHSTVEEEFFYPALREALPENERALIDDAFADHADVLQTLAELSDMPRDNEEFREMLSELRDAVLQHVEEEEDELFARARQAIGAAGLADVGARMQVRKEELKETAHA